MVNIVKHGVKYSSITHYMLNYAKMKSRIGDGTFSLDEYRSFRQKADNITNLKRSIDTLLRNGHIQKVSSNRYKFTEIGSRCLIDLRLTYKQRISTDSREQMLEHIRNQKESA